MTALARSTRCDECAGSLQTTSALCNNPYVNAAASGATAQNGATCIVPGPTYTYNNGMACLAATALAEMPEGYTCCDVTMWTHYTRLNAAPNPHVGTPPWPNLAFLEA